MTRLFGRTVKCGPDVHDMDLSIGSTGTLLQRSSSSEESSDLGSDAKENVALSPVPRKLNYVQKHTSIREEENGAISLIFSVKSKIVGRRGRSLRRRSHHVGLSTNAETSTSKKYPNIADSRSKLDTVRNSSSFTQQKNDRISLIMPDGNVDKPRRSRGARLRQAWGSSLQKLNGGFRRLGCARAQDIVVIDPIDSFEMRREIDQLFSDR